MIHVRRMTEDDIPSCARIMAETPLWQRYGVTFSRAAERFRRTLAGGGTVFVADEAGEVVGFVMCVERGAWARSGYIPLIGVAPTHKGKGIGLALLQRAESFLSHSSSDVFLLVSDFNTPAQRFYERHGYTRVGALPDYILPGVTEYIYWKRLK
ncbi:MAG: GNAT family N-acetyltransferase [Chloroflexi bacterium]|nr:GNAT family N-acetyltransferase [Chloroflexota bacterium]